MLKAAPFIAGRVVRVLGLRREERCRGLGLRGIHAGGRRLGGANMEVRRCCGGMLEEWGGREARGLSLGGGRRASAGGGEVLAGQGVW